jgi:hypothetical protein
MRGADKILVHSSHCRLRAGDVTGHRQNVLHTLLDDLYADSKRASNFTVT